MIMQCISSVTYKVNQNGWLEAWPIHSERGLRQGDLLSSYLLIMCAEGLFACITDMEHRA